MKSDTKLQTIMYSADCEEHASSIDCFVNYKGISFVWKWCDIQPSMVTHTQNLCSAFTHPSAHTQQWTHTHTVNTPGTVGSHFMHRAQGAGRSWGFGALLKGTSSWYWRWRERCTFTPPIDYPCRTETRIRNFRLWVRLSNIRPWPLF